jgi:hypothetical protein
MSTPATDARIAARAVLFYTSTAQSAAVLLAERFSPVSTVLPARLADRSSPANFTDA